MVEVWDKGFDGGDEALDAAGHEERVVVFTKEGDFGDKANGLEFNEEVDERLSEFGDTNERFDVRL